MSESSEPRLLHQYRSWIEQLEDEHVDTHQREFFEHALIVLDTNVLLSLYELHASARDEVINALKRVQSRLWLPYQVGLEFVRRRHAVIATRTRTLNSALTDLEKRFTAARQSVIAARDEVVQLYIKYAWNYEIGQELAESITQQSVDAALLNMKQDLRKRVRKLKDDHDLALGSLDSDDRVLPIVGWLYGDRIAAPVPGATIYERVNHAISYRFPNRIPPGFSDATKETDLDRAGDYLIWEEIIERAQELPEPRRVMVVSSDEKMDWYQPAEPGRAARPWPTLSDELWARAHADLKILKSAEFLKGAHLYLDVQISSATYEEIDRATETLVESNVNQDAVRAVDDLRRRLLSGEPPDDVLDSYVHVKNVLAQSMQALARNQLDEGRSAFHKLREEIAHFVALKLQGKIPEKYLQIPYGRQSHEEVFALLYQNMDRPVSSEHLRILTGGSIHAERRVRELRELGIPIEAVGGNGEALYILRRLDVNMSQVISVFQSHIRNDRASSPAERDRILQLLDEIRIETDDE
ncbi:PIN-like domain-containing protein [Nonomuraea sp. NPDC052129]|uniref:PIN-like domain-containing protein n=1 Tax=Nonomuraea sp. NPDC052129 TaxID=3154651 RepID=UPI0034412908